MRSTRLLLLLMIMSASAVAAAQTAQSGEPAPMVATVENLPSLNGNGIPQSFQLTPAGPRADTGRASSNDICYRIRAYIFKRDDDHAPQFLRSTTCGPRQPHEKDADWPRARLVPAK